MRIAMFSNYLNEHQLPLCEAINAHDGVEFSFVALEEHGILPGRSNLNESYPYVEQEYLGLEQEKQALRHVEQDDIVIFGHMSGKEQYV